VGESGPAEKAGVAGTVPGAVAGCSNCAFADGVGDMRNELAVGDAMLDSLNLEGDRESDLRSDRTVEPTSTW
jgi:hypothetical protein